MQLSLCKYFPSPSIVHTFNWTWSSNYSANLRRITELWPVWECCCCFFHDAFVCRSVVDRPMSHMITSYISHRSYVQHYKAAEIVHIIISLTFCLATRWKRNNLWSESLIEPKNFRIPCHSETNVLMAAVKFACLHAPSKVTQNSKNFILKTTNKQTNNIYMYPPTEMHHQSKSKDHWFGNV